MDVRVEGIEQLGHLTAETWIHWTRQGPRAFVARMMALPSDHKIWKRFDLTTKFRPRLEGQFEPMFQELMRLVPILSKGWEGWSPTSVWTKTNANMTAVMFCGSDRRSLILSKQVISMLPGLDGHVLAVGSTTIPGHRNKGVRDMQRHKKAQAAQAGRQGRTERLLLKSEIPQLQEIKFRDREGRWIRAYSIGAVPEVGKVPVVFAPLIGDKVYATGQERVCSPQLPTIGSSDAMSVTVDANDLN